MSTIMKEVKTLTKKGKAKVKKDIKLKEAAEKRAASKERARCKKIALTETYKEALAEIKEEASKGNNQCYFSFYPWLYSAVVEHLVPVLTKEGFKVEPHFDPGHESWSNCDGYMPAMESASLTITWK